MLWLQLYNKIKQFNKQNSPGEESKIKASQTGFECITEVTSRRKEQVLSPLE